MEKKTKIKIVQFIFTIILLSPLYIGLYIIQNFPLYDLFIGVWTTFWFWLLMEDFTDNLK